jgi:cell division protein FtsL
MAILQRTALPGSGRISRPQSLKPFMIASIALAIVIAGAQVNQFSRLTSTGYEIEGLKRERAAKQAANHELEAEVARLSSLARIDWEARTRLGMTPATRTMYIDVNAELPARQSLPTRYLPDAVQQPAPTVDADSDSIWERALKLLPF